MNKKQRRALKIAAALIVLALLFPPARYDSDLFYTFLFWNFSGHVDVLMLLAEWIGICLLMGIRYVLVSDKNSPSA